MGIGTLLRAMVSRNQPQSQLDKQEDTLRAGRYQELYILPAVRKSHVLADEGSYYVANNLGAGLATVAAPTAFSDLAPLLTIENQDLPSNSNNKRIHLDWIRLTQTAAGTGATDLRLRGVLDYTSPSGGTALTPLSPNSDLPKSDTIAVVRLLPVGVAQSGKSRVIVGTQVAIPTQTAPLAALSEVFINFGGVEGAMPLYDNAAGTAIVNRVLQWPPVIIGPGSCFMLEFLLTAQSVASSWTAELGWWER